MINIYFKDDLNIYPGGVEITERNHRITWNFVNMKCKYMKSDTENMLVKAASFSKTGTCLATYTILVQPPTMHNRARH